MEATVENKSQVKNNNKDKPIQRRSLNAGQASSKNKLQQELGTRGHASEALQPASVNITSAEKSQKAIASLQKHRDKKSTQKASLENKSSMKKATESKASQSKSKFGKSELNMVQEGEKWVSQQQGALQILNGVETQNQNEQNDNKTVKPKSRNNSKASKANLNQEKDEKEKVENLKAKTPAKSASKSLAKGTAQSKKSKSTKKTERDIASSPLKRSSIIHNELTNQSSVGVEEVKSRKKSNLKSKKKE